MKNNKILIPEGWEKEILLYELFEKNIIKLGRGRVISSVDLVETPGNYPVYSSSSQQNGFFGAYGLYDFDKELITWSVDGGGYFFYRPKHKFSVTNVSGILRVLDESKFDYKFLYYLLVYQHSKEIFDYIDKAHPSVIKKRYLIPKIDLSEQKKIAEILSKVDTAIEQTQSLIAKYRRIKTGLMQDLLTKGIDENGNIRNEKTHKFKDSELGRIPKEWEIDSLYNLCEVIVDCKHRTSPFIVQSIYPVIRTNNIKEGKLVWKDMKFTDGKSYKIWTDQAIPKAEDVIITREAPLGQVLKIPYNLTPILGQRTILFRTDKKKLIPDYLVFSVLIEKMQLYLNNISVGSTVHHLKVGEMKAIQLALPTNIDEQRRVLVKLNIQEKYISKLIFEKDKLQSIKTALMQDLLSGKKRVTNLIK